MNTAVRYISRGGNTKKVAEAIAAAAGVEAMPVPEALPPGIELLFLGGALYGFDIDPALVEFIETLSPDPTLRVAVFSTAAVKASAYPQIKKRLVAKGITVLEQEFHCRGHFAVLHKNKPDQADLTRASQFALELLHHRAPQ